MKNSEAAKLIALLEGAYPFPLGDAAGVYEQFMLDMDFDVAWGVVVALIAECEKRPAIATIRNRYAEAKSGIPSAEAAWAEVSMAMRSGSRTRTPKFSHILIEQVVREMSWYNLCSSNLPAADRAAFRERYRELREQDVQQVQTAGVLAAPSLKLLLGGGK